MKTVTIADLVFRKPDDATAMQLLRALFRVGAAPDSQEARAVFWGKLAALCVSLSNARRLCERLDGDGATLRRIVEVVTALPPGALGR